MYIAKETTSNTIVSIKIKSLEDYASYIKRSGFGWHDIYRVYKTKKAIKAGQYIFYKFDGDDLVRCKAQLFTIQNYG